jgi:hypothetical protein
MHLILARGLSGEYKITAKTGLFAAHLHPFLDFNHAASYARRPSSVLSKEVSFVTSNNSP